MLGICGFGQYTFQWIKNSLPSPFIVASIFTFILLWPYYQTIRMKERKNAFIVQRNDRIQESSRNRPPIIFQQAPCICTCVCMYCCSLFFLFFLFFRFFSLSFFLSFSLFISSFSADSSCVLAYEKSYQQKQNNLIQLLQ